MKFTLHFDSKDFLVCDSCGRRDFKLVRNKKLSADKAYELFLFYECPNCAGAGFWTHATAIDEKRRIGIALVRCRAPAAAKPRIDKFQVSNKTV